RHTRFSRDWSSDVCSSDLGCATRAHAGDAALAALIAGDDCDTVVAAIVGAAGLESTLAAARAGKRLLLANKESLELAGELLMQTARAGGATIVPIDSEHNAIFQCLHGRDADARVRRVTLTASGGPFRGRSRAELAGVTPAQAVAHPKWSMGPKISVDSATLMNKGLELIEARHLFGLPEDRLEVLVHPQSLVHSLVEFIDGSVLAQLGLPDMRTAPPVGLGWPQRLESGVGALDLAPQGPPEFGPPGLETSPRPRLPPDRRRAGGTAPRRTPSPARAWRARRCAPAAPPRPRSTPPTRWRFQPFFRAASVSCPSPPWWRTRSRRSRSSRPRHWKRCAASTPARGATPNG